MKATWYLWYLPALALKLFVTALALNLLLTVLRLHLKFVIVVVSTHSNSAFTYMYLLFKNNAGNK